MRTDYKTPTSKVYIVEPGELCKGSNDDHRPGHPDFPPPHPWWWFGPWIDSGEEEWI